jgi:apolipoprotein N-acyltransferase
MNANDVLAQAHVPLVRLPEAIPRPIVAIAAMVVLAGLDMLGALLARRWAHGGSVLCFGAGAVCFVVLFWLYASSLRYADLVAVTFGWIAALQIGLMLVGRASSAPAIPGRTWVAAAAIVALEGYLLASSDSG